MAMRRRQPLERSSPSPSPGSDLSVFRFPQAFPIPGPVGDLGGWRQLPARVLCHPLKIERLDPELIQPPRVVGVDLQRRIKEFGQSSRKAETELLRELEAASGSVLRLNSLLELRLREQEFQRLRDPLTELGLSLQTLRAAGLSDGSVVELSTVGGSPRVCLARVRAITAGRLCSSCPGAEPLLSQLAQDRGTALLSPLLAFRLGLSAAAELQPLPQLRLRPWTPRSLLDGVVPEALPNQDSALPALLPAVPTAAVVWVRALPSLVKLERRSQEVEAALHRWFSAAPRFLQLGAVFPVPLNEPPEEGEARTTPWEVRCVFFQVHGFFLDDGLQLLESSPLRARAASLFLHGSSAALNTSPPAPSVQGLQEGPAEQGVRPSFRLFLVPDAEAGSLGSSLPGRASHFVVDPLHTALVQQGPVAQLAAPYPVEEFLSAPGLRRYQRAVLASFLSSELAELQRQMRVSLTPCYPTLPTCFSFPHPPMPSAGPSDALAQRSPALFLSGKRGSGKRSLVSEASRSLGLHLLECNLYDLCTGSSLQALRENLAELAKQARSLCPCVLHIRRLDVLSSFAKASLTPQQIEEVLGLDFGGLVQQLRVPPEASAEPRSLENLVLSSLSRSGGEAPATAGVFLVCSASEKELVPATVSSVFTHKMQLALPGRRARQKLCELWLQELHPSCVDLPPCSSSSATEAAAPSEKVWRPEDPLAELQRAQNNTGRSGARSNILAFIKDVDIRRNASPTAPKEAKGPEGTAPRPPQVDPELAFKLAKQTAGASCWDCFSLLLDALSPAANAQGTQSSSALDRDSTRQVLDELDASDHEGLDEGDEQEERAVIPLDSRARARASAELLLRQASAQQKRFAELRPSAASGIPNVRWEDIGGLEHIKREIMDIVELPLLYPDLFAAGAKKRSGVLLWGPPGVGKTLVAKAVATECQLSFISVKGPELLNMYVGESEQNVRAVFQQAREAAPAVLFFDELDALAPARGQGNSGGNVMDRVVSQLLAEIDGVNASGAPGPAGAEPEEPKDIFVIGATNRPDLIDSALLRPGRLDRCVYLSLPRDHEGQLKILQALTRRFRLAPDVDLLAVARRCALNFTGADFYALCSDALLVALRRIVNEREARLRRLEASGRTREFLEDDGAEEIKEESPSEQTPQQDEAVEPRDSVVVGQADFLQALSVLRPSLSVEELQRYERLRLRFAEGQP